MYVLPVNNPLQKISRNKHISEEEEKVEIGQDKHTDIQKKIKEIQENNEDFAVKTKETKRVGGAISLSR